MTFALALSAALALTPISADQFVKDYMAETNLPGAVVVVTKDGQVVHAAGYGHDAGGKPLTADSPMPLASLSKSFTARGVMRLVEQGKVKLDAPVRSYLPEFTMADPRYVKITVRQLLDQTSGMSDSTFPELTLDAPATLKDSVAMLRDAKLAGEPGEKFRYHNPNYAVLARMVEKVANKPFADYMAAEVFAPLGMNSTRTVDLTTQQPGASRGYVRAYGQVIQREQPTWFVNGGAGVVSTANDLGRWLIAQKGQVGADGTYSAGWSSARSAAGTPLLHHTGWLLTHNSVQTVIPSSGYGIAVVTNTGMMSGDDAVNITEGLIQLTEGKAAEITEPFTMKSDYVLAALTLLSAGLGVLGVVRARRWARRGGWWRWVRLAAYAVPIVAFFTAADLFGLLMNRSGTLGMITYVWLALFVWLAVSALAAAAVVAARIISAVSTSAGRRAASRPSGT
ncbi:serine hydrolase domain-containing protein [Nonomuraea sp. NPDC050556]|uniref:serine hydrolase domain-containing protein n=1 Tax=Nonomuraea sp. NPDC050556 TaxID=3364369 RepID=UPI0037A7CED2